MTKTAAKSAKTPKADKDQELLDASAKRTAALAEADAKFTEAVAKAAADRKKVYDAYPDSGNFAERSWNATKGDDDVPYDEVASTFRGKLDTAVDTIKATGNADIAGLEDFEAEVVRLLKEANEPVGGVVAPVTE